MAAETGARILIAALIALNYWASWRLIKKARAAKPPGRIGLIILRDVFLTVLLLYVVIPMSPVIRVIGALPLVVLVAVQVLFTFRSLRSRRD